MEAINAITQEAFLKEPARYFGALNKAPVEINSEHGDVVLISAEEFDNIQDLIACYEAEAEVARGEFYTEEEFNKITEEMVKKLNAK